MIRFFIKFRIMKGCEEQYLKEVKPCILASRLEPGCLDYTAFWNGESNTLTLFESYIDQDAVDYHCSRPYSVEDFMALQKYYVGGITGVPVEAFQNPLV